MPNLRCAALCLQRWRWRGAVHASAAAVVAALCITRAGLPAERDVSVPVACCAASAGSSAGMHVTGVFTLGRGGIRFGLAPSVGPRAASRRAGPVGRPSGRQASAACVYSPFLPHGWVDQVLPSVCGTGCPSLDGGACEGAVAERVTAVSATALVLPVTAQWHSVRAGPAAAGDTIITAVCSSSSDLFRV
jgi:hypothetical protein